MNVKSLIDTGVIVDVIDNPTYQSLKTKVKLEPTKTKIVVYGSSTPLKLHGCFPASIESNSRFTVSTFHVVDGTGGNLPSAKTVQELAHIQLVDTVKGINATKEPPQANKQDVAPVNNAGTEEDIPHSEHEVIDKLLEKHKNVFIGEGKIKGQLVNLHIREDITPVLQPQRRIPYHMRKVDSARYNRISYRSAYPLDISHSMLTKERWRHTNLR